MVLHLCLLSRVCVLATVARTGTIIIIVTQCCLLLTVVSLHFKQRRGTAHLPCRLLPSTEFSNWHAFVLVGDSFGYSFFEVFWEAKEQ